MEIEVLAADRLRFRDGGPVRAASAVVPFGDGHLVVSDDATRAAWFREGTMATPVRLLPRIAGHDVFDEASGTKHLKPDLETACQVVVDGEPAALVMGSGSSPARMRWCLLRLEDGRPRTAVADMTHVYGTVAAALGDVVALPGGDLIASAAAEDSPNPRDDGPVVATALAHIREDRVTTVAPLPKLDDSLIKVEGLMVLDADEK
jgi:hypothetical protein